MTPARHEEGKNVWPDICCCLKVINQHLFLLEHCCIIELVSIQRELSKNFLTSLLGGCVSHCCRGAFLHLSFTIVSPQQQVEEAWLHTSSEQRHKLVCSKCEKLCQSQCIYRRSVIMCARCVFLCRTCVREKRLDRTQINRSVMLFAWMEENIRRKCVTKDALWWSLYNSRMSI